MEIFKSSRVLTDLMGFIVRQRWSLVMIWLVIGLTLLYFAVKLPNVLTESGFETEGSFNQVETELYETFKQPQLTMQLVFVSKSIETSEKEYSEFIKKTVADLKEVDHLIKVVTPLENPNQAKGKIAYVILGFNKNTFGELKNSIEQIRNQLKSTKEITVGVTGTPVIADDMTRASEHDLKRAEAIGIPAAFIILIFAFGSLTAAILPVITGVTTVTSTMGILYILSSYYDFSLYVLNVVPMIGLALGIDFGLLLVNRFKDEFLYHDKQTAVVKALFHAGRSIVFSAICVLVGLGAMYLVQVDVFQSIAISGSIAVLLSVLTATTLLPALLILFGDSVGKNNKKSEISKGVFWKSLAQYVMKRPIKVFVFAFLFLLILIYPLKDIKFFMSGAESLPQEYESRQLYEELTKSFGEASLFPVFIIAEAKSRLELERETAELIQSLEVDPYVSKVTPNVNELNQLIKNNQNTEFLIGNKILLRIQLNVKSTSTAAKKWANDWDADFKNLKVVVGGNSKYFQEIFEQIYIGFPKVLIIVTIITLGLLVIAFRSILIPIKAVVLNLISLASSMGLLVWVFQKADLVDSYAIDIMIPILTFSVVYTLSMDYEIFLISRIQEIYVKTKDNDQATLLGLTHTSKIITSAALIIVMVTGAFGFTDVLPTKQAGLSIAFAILIDATIIRLFMVPSLMKLLGDWNWWMPAFNRRSLKKLKHERKLS